MKLVLTFCALIIMVNPNAFAKALTENLQRKPNQAGEENSTRILISDISCSGKSLSDASISYTFNIYSNFAPGSRRLVNASGVKFSTHENGTGSVLKEYDSMREDEIFDNDKKAKKFFLNSKFVINVDEGSIAFDLSKKIGKFKIVKKNGTFIYPLKCEYKL